MDDNKALLERMASISPGARLHITGELWQQNIDPDEINSQMLVLECFSILVDEAYELGIEFFCTKPDLCESFYFVDKVLLLFEVLFPAPLYRSITEDAAFNRVVRAIVVDGAGDPDETSVMNILNFLVEDHPEAQSVFQDTFDFLFDKMRSTPVFDSYVSTILEADNTPLSVPVDIATLTLYLDHVNIKVARLLKAIDAVGHAGLVAQDDLQRQYNRLDLYKTNATEPEASVQYAWVLQMGQAQTPTAIEQALMVRFCKNFDSITPFFEDYFRIRATPLDKSDMISLVLGCFDDTDSKETFAGRVDTVLQRLTTPGQQPTTDLHLMVQRVTLALIQEFYP